MAYLNTNEMQEAAEVFVEAFGHVLGNFLGDSKSEIKKFAAELILREKPYMMVTEEGIPRIQQMVFIREDYRDFIFTLHYTFFARWGHSANAVDGLIGNIARGVALSNLTTYSAMPKELATRLPTEENAISILKANNWLVIVMLIQLFVTLSESDLNQNKK
ncbi:MAG: hypothetical protein ACD_84C00038G0006 [uncultured bacterium]|nr:MAG: hypothetical protein ACD_84C00038G0006 [uncultured bacterium]